MGSSDDGYNPLRWDCERNGCFNLKRRPKIEAFARCFPRRCNFGDVDGMVEINGKALLLEWKTKLKTRLPMGQEIAYKKLTETELISVILIVGNAETMECEKYCYFFKGTQCKWKTGSLEKIKQSIKKWSIWANGANF